MSDVFEVAMGRLYVTKGPAVLTTSSIGSCLAICLYSQLHQTGGLAHIMLPKHFETEVDPTNEANHRYADVAIAVMVASLEERGVSRSQMTAKIVGGANMFPDVQGRSQKVGERNIASVKDILTGYAITLNGEETGGHTGRSVTFDLSNGIVTITMTL